MVRFVLQFLFSMLFLFFSIRTFSQPFSINNCARINLNENLS